MLSLAFLNLKTSLNLNIYLLQILVTFGKIGRRNMPILRSLGFHIAKNRGFLDIKQVIEP